MPVIVQPDPEERKKALLEKQRRQRRRKEKIENDRQKSMGLRRGLLGRKGEKQVVPKAAVDVLIAKSMAVPSRARYTFSITDIRKYYLHNKSFQEIINTGKYFYFENHLVLMTKEAFIVKNGKLSLNCELTDFEKKYCVQCVEEKISHVVKTPLHSETGHVTDVPLKAWIVVQKFARATEHATVTGDVKADFEDFVMMLLGTGFGGEPPFDTFGGLLSRYMQRENITNEKLCELTEISVRTIQRYRNDEVEPSLPYIIAICIALKLNPCYSEKVILSAGRVLGNSKRDLAYKHLLYFAYQIGDVAWCNEFLIELDLEPLTDKRS